MKPPFASHTLDNGLQVVVETMPGVKTAAAGFLVRTGSRDEGGELAGVSHFLEHMCFKGTPKRDARQINVDFDTLGGRQNAFTSHDRTFYHSATRAEDNDRQIEILADMMKSVLPPDEFETEKKTVLEEIALYDDHLEHLAYHFIMDRLFDGHAMQRPVLGYVDTVGKMTRDGMHAYFRERYAPDNMRLFCSGGVEPRQVFESAERYCAAWEPSNVNGQRRPPEIHRGVAVKTVPRFNQQVVALCFTCPSAVDPMHDTANAAAQILGGENSRMYWNVVQKGLSSRASAIRMECQDCGVLIVYGITEPDKCEALIEALRAEAARIAYEPVADHEIQRVKNRQRTGLAIEGELSQRRLYQVMDDVDYRGAPRTVEERVAAVEAIDARAIAELFETYPVDGEGYLISVGPRDWPKG